MYSVTNLNLSPTIGTESQVGIFTVSHSQRSVLTRGLQRVFFILLPFDTLLYIVEVSRYSSRL